MDRNKPQSDIVVSENFEFVDKIEDFQCIFCKTLYKKQYRLSCEHFICQKCHNSRLKKCPTCNYYVEIKGAIIYMDLKVQKLRVRCVNKDCTFEETMKNFLENHKTCLFSTENVSSTKDEVLQSQKSINIIEERLVEILEPEKLIEEMKANFIEIQPVFLEVKMKQEINVNNVKKEPKISILQCEYKNYAEAELTQFDDSRYKDEENLRVKLLYSEDDYEQNNNFHIEQEPFAFTVNKETNDVHPEELFNKNEKIFNIRKSKQEEKTNGLEKTIVKLQLENNTLKKILDAIQLEMDEKIDQLQVNNWKQIYQIEEQFQTKNSKQNQKLNGLEISIDVFKTEILNKLQQFENKLETISKCIINEDNITEHIFQQQKTIKEEFIKSSLEVKKSLLIKKDHQLRQKLSQDVIENDEISKENIYKHLDLRINEMENGISANSEDVLWCVNKVKKNELLILKMAEIVSNNSENLEEINRDLNQKSVEENERKIQLKNLMDEFNSKNEKVEKLNGEIEKMGDSILAHEISANNFSKLITTKLDKNVESVNEMAEEVNLYKDRIHLIGDQFSQQIKNLVENIIELKEEFNEKSNGKKNPLHRTTLA